ncbi:hypothetical protein ACIBI9_30535 [Nonomuraea sp. NPDC050451]|uniref:hypothetical protein n=1 Tax=Nonomuraea sp. NPDC050451 TaxID=3364364 RepID=UPI0037AE1DC1
MGNQLNLARLEAAGGELVSATEEADATTAGGTFTRGMLMELAAFESDRSGEQWAEAYSPARPRCSRAATKRMWPIRTSPRWPGGLIGTGSPRRASARAPGVGVGFWVMLVGCGLILLRLRVGVGCRRGQLGGE